MIIRNGSKPIRTVLWWQLLITVIVASVAGLLTGIHGAISAMLGGLVSIFAGWVFAIMISFSKDGSAEGALYAALRAEAVKIGLIVLLLWLVLATYQDVVVLGFIGSFVISVVIFGMAIFVRDK